MNRLKNYDYDLIKELAGFKIYFVQFLICLTFTLAILFIGYSFISIRIFYFLLFGILFIYIAAFIHSINTRIRAKRLTGAVEASFKNKYGFSNSSVGVDVIKITLGKNLLRLADLSYSNGSYNIQDGFLLCFIKLLRDRLIYLSGYIIPLIRVMESGQNNECRIYVRGNVKAAFNVYPELICIDKLPDNFDKEYKEENYVILDKPAYWVKADDIPVSFECNRCNSLRIIFEILMFICIKNADEILQIQDIKKLLKQLKKNYKEEYNCLNKSLDCGKIKNVMANLIKENISVKDFVNIISLIKEYGIENNPDYLSEKIRNNNTFRDQITQKYSVNGAINAYLISEKTTQKIQKAQSYKEEKEIIDEFERKINKNSKNIIICNPDIRLKLFRIINEVFVKTSVLSYSEILKSTEIKARDII